MNFNRELISQQRRPVEDMSTGDASFVFPADKKLPQTPESPFRAQLHALAAGVLGKNDPSEPILDTSEINQTHDGQEAETLQD